MDISLQSQWTCEMHSCHPPWSMLLMQERVSPLTDSMSWSMGIWQFIPPSGNRTHVSWEVDGWSYENQINIALFIREFTWKYRERYAKLEKSDLLTWKAYSMMENIRELWNAPYMNDAMWSVHRISGQFEKLINLHLAHCYINDRKKSIQIRGETEKSSWGYERHHICIWSLQEIWYQVCRVL